MVTYKHPNNPATVRQLWKIKELSGEDTTGLKVTMKEAGNIIEKLELEKIAKESNALHAQDSNDDAPFSEPHVCIVEGDQRSGKTAYAVGNVVDAFNKDCAVIWCKKVNIRGEVKSYDRTNRIVRIKDEGRYKYYKIPETYQLISPMRIFSNIHLYGLPYVYVPSFRHMQKWLKNGFISNGWLIMDEAHVGISARNGMSKQGKGFVDQYFQFGKSRLEVFLITHMARLIDWTARTVPTKRVHCTYDKTTRIVTYTCRKKGQAGTNEFHFYAPQYWGNYRTNEKVNA